MCIEFQIWFPALVISISASVCSRASQKASDLSSVDAPLPHTVTAHFQSARAARGSREMQRGDTIPSLLLIVRLC